MTAVRVILVEPEKSGNIGSIARSMRNFDIHELWIVNPKAGIDGDARAYAMHGLEVVQSARIVETLSEALKGVDVIVGTSAVAARSSSNLSRVSITPQQLAQRVAGANGTVGVVFGRESAGLNRRELEACDFIVTIPASAGYNVLNIASAATIIFYELFNNTNASQVELASQATKDRLLLEFGRLVGNCSLQPHRRRLARRAFRNVISRSFVSKREASLLVGVLRKTNSKLVQT
jgi:tRNA/rRNA methyltransferase